MAVGRWAGCPSGLQAVKPADSASAWPVVENVGFCVQTVGPLNPSGRSSAPAVGSWWGLGEGSVTLR